MDVDITCPSCAKEYQDQNPPRLLTCGHTYCQNCIALLVQKNTSQSLICPEDQLTISIPSNINQFPKNIALMRIIEGNRKNSSNNSSASLKDTFFDVSKINKQQYCQEDQDTADLISAIQRGSVRKESQLLADELPEIQAQAPQLSLAGNANQVQASQKRQETQLCLLHQRPIEVICMIDCERLCSKCALFGQHKGHQFKSIEEIERQNRIAYQQIVKVFSQKQKFMQHISNKTVEKEIINILSIKKTNLKKEISQKFKKLVEELGKAERSTYKRLEDANTIFTQRVQNCLLMDKQLFSFYESWESKALEIIREHQNLSQEGQVRFYLNGVQIYKEGKELLSQFQKTQNIAQFQALKIIQDFTIKFHQSAFSELLNNLVSVSQHGKQQVEKKYEVIHRLKQNEATLANRQKCQISKKNLIQRHQSDQSLLQFGQIETQSLAGSMSHSQMLNESFISTKDQIIAKTKDVPNRTLAKKNKSTFTARERVTTKQVAANPPTLSREDIKRKLKALKVPEKYEKVLQGILNDSLQTVDLTNAQLGDSQVLKILDLMKFNTKVKAIKLIRNKLTDEGLAPMLPFFSNLITINLSQNQLTQNALSMFADNKGNMPFLKNVILSQTKIVERKSKPIIQKLKKMQVCVSV